jgi:propanol-preferring alcohol dehydrogenase
MKAWLYTKAGEPLQLIERETPRPGLNEAVVQVRASGLCGSDVHILHGSMDAMLNGPRILGHEIAGVVGEIGEGVTGFKPGDRVVVSGVPSYAPGFQVDGGYATHCLVRASALRRLPDRVSFMQGAAATDAGQTSYGALMHKGGLKKGQKVGIIGLGGVGLTGARIAVINGASEVYAAEPRQEMWDIARGQGVKVVVDEVRKLADLAPDLIVDFAGFGTTTAGAIEAVAFGGTIVQVGAAVLEATINVGYLIGKELTFRGSQGGPPGATEAVLAHMERGELEILSSTLSFDEIPEGLERLERGSVNGRLVAEIFQD